MTNFQFNMNTTNDDDAWKFLNRGLFDETYELENLSLMSVVSVEHCDGDWHTVDVIARCNNTNDTYSIGVTYCIVPESNKAFPTGCEWELYEMPEQN